MYNGHGDVVALTDTSGNVVATYEYDEWGNITNQTGNIDSPFTYAGQYGYVYDKETGLYFLKSRYYDAEIGRFTSKDRFMGFENRPASQNHYTYTENDPVNKVDPYGNISSYYWNKIFYIAKLLVGAILLGWSIYWILEGPFTIVIWVYGWRVILYNLFYIIIDFYNPGVASTVAARMWQLAWWMIPSREFWDVRRALRI